MAWLSLHVGPWLHRRFHTMVQGLWPYAMEPVGENRVAWVGASWGTIHRKVAGEGGNTVIREEPNRGLAVAKNAMFEKQQGRNDGYFLLMEHAETPRAGGQCELRSGEWGKAVTGMFSRKKTNRTLFGLFAAAAVLSDRGNGADWPQWRGPRRDGVSDETGLRGVWPTNGPPLLWKVSGLGQGYGSVAMSGGTVYAAGSVDGEGLLTAMTVDGRILWTRKYGAEHTGTYAGARSTPTVADGMVYAMSGTGTLVCFEAGGGEIVWRKDVVGEFGGQPSIKWGYGESVLIADNLAICTPGGSNVTCVALDRRTGATVWKSPGLGQRHAMCSPVVVRHGKKRLIVTQTVRHVVGICAETGALLWICEMPQKGHHDDAVKPCTPICADGHVVVANAGTGAGGVKLRLADDASSVSETWSQPRFQADTGGAVLCRGRLYAAVGKGTWLCMDWATGDVIAELTPVAGRAGGTCIVADGHLLCRGLGGRLDLVRIAENAFEPISSFVLPDMPPGNEHRTPLALADGTLYVRYKDTLAAFALKR